MRSTTLKNPPLAGKEPAKKSTLAIEVVYSSGGIADLKKYQYLGVKEVWFWENNEITFYSLNSNYVEIQKSVYLSKLNSKFLVNFVNRGLTESPLTIEADFLLSLNNLT